MQQKRRFGTYWVSDYSGQISGPKIADIRTNMFCSRCQVEFPIEERHKHFYGRKHMLCETESEILRLLDELAKKMSGERKRFVRFMQEDIMDSFQRLASDGYFNKPKKLKKSKSRLNSEFKVDYKRYPDEKNFDWEKHKHCCEEA